MMRRKLRQAFCMFLILVMTVSAVPLSAFAAPVTQEIEGSASVEETGAEESVQLTEEWTEDITDEQPAVAESMIEEPMSEELCVEEVATMEEEAEDDSSMLQQEQIGEGIVEEKDDYTLREASQRTVISDVAVYTYMPVGGREASFEAWTLTEGARVYVEGKYSNTYHGVRWYDVTQERYLQEGDEWITGHSYTVDVCLYVMNYSYEFAVKMADGEGQMSLMPCVNTTINDENASIKSLPDIRETSGYVAKYTFSACETAPPDITQVGVDNLTQPVAGQKVDFDVTLSGEGYGFTYETEGHYINGLLWYDYTKGRYLQKEDRFEAEHEYWLIIPISRKQPYQFAVGEDGKSTMTATSIADKTYVIDPSNPGSPQRKMEIHCEFAALREPITTVAVTGIKEPVEGNTPDYFAEALEPDMYGIPSKAYEPIVWYEDGNIMESTDTFQDGCTYSVSIEVYAKEENTFQVTDSMQPDVIGTLDGKNAVVRKAWEQSADEVIELYYEFGECPNSEIEEVLITGLEEPLPGNYPDYTATACEDIYYIPKNNYPSYGEYYEKLNGIYWYDATDGRRIYNTETFIAGHDYEVYIDLSVSNTDEYVFALDNNNQSLVTATIQNNYGNEIMQSTGAEAKTSNGFWEHTVSCSFPWDLPELVIVKVYDIEHPTAGQKPDYAGNVDYDNLIEIDTVEWFKEDGSSLRADDLFEAGEKYTLEVALKPVRHGSEDACKFSKGAYVQINGSVYGDIPNQEIEVTTGANGEWMKLRAVYVGQKESDYVPIESLSFENSCVIFEPYYVGDLGLKVYPDNADYQEIVYTSSDPSVVTIIENYGPLARKPGVAVITASTRDGKKSAQVLVWVSDDGFGWPAEFVDVLAKFKEIQPINGSNYKEEIKDVQKARDVYDALQGDLKKLLGYCGIIPNSYEGQLYNRFLEAEAYYKEMGLWSTNIPAQRYSGKALKPEFQVYYGLTLLKSGKDYSVKWVNNTNAAKSNAIKAPTVVITGKGNFTGTLEKKFTIEPINFDEYSTNKELQEVLKVSPIIVKSTGKIIKSKPTVKLNGKTITEKSKEYTLSYDETTPGAYTDVGEWPITVVGSGKNFVGSMTVTQTISPKLISKAKVTLDKSSYPYNDVTGVTYPNTVAVKDGKTTLTEGTDYRLSYENCSKIGTATVKVTGIGNYSGTIKKTYQITGIKLTSKMVTQAKNFTYDGSPKAVEQNVDYKLAYKGTDLVRGVDYTVSYSGNRTNAGKFKVTFKGINKYSGSITKTFTINSASVTNAEISLTNADNIIFEKSGAKPKPVVYFNGELLKEGTDYTITYGNNKKVATKDSKNAPYLYITGKGNLKGNTKKTPSKFTIVGASLSHYAQITAADLLYANKKNNYVPAITVTDRNNGKKLAKKTDYSATYTYEVWDAGLGEYRKLTGNKVTDADFAGDRIKMRVTVTGVNNYSGKISAEYEIYKKNIASLTVEKIANQVYSGKSIEPEIVVTRKVKEGKKYVYYPVDTSNYEVKYTNNINKGTATVYIYGKGEYGGVKKVTFKITGQKMQWWNIFDN